MSNLKDLHKIGRDIREYLNEDGTLKKYCITCIHRLNSKDFGWGDWLWSEDGKGYKACNPIISKPIFSNWSPRVDINSFITEEDLKI